MNTIHLYHGSNIGLDSISGDIGPGNIFGGIFASARKDAAESHGTRLYVIELPESAVLSSSALESVDDDAVMGLLRAAMPWIKDWEDMADDVRTAVIEDAARTLDDDRLVEIFAAEGATEADWEAQRIRGLVARGLGYLAVECHDEHGTSWLVLPGAEVRELVD